jgi:hypothetical protein
VYVHSFSMHRLTLRFSLDQERHFASVYDRRYRRQFRNAALVGALVYAVYGLLDASLVSPQIGVSLVVRCAVVILAALAAVLSLSRAIGPAHAQALGAGVVALAGVGLEVLAFASPVPAHPAFLPTGLMQAMCFGLIARVRFAYMAGVGAVFVLGWAVGTLIAPAAAYPQAVFFGVAVGVLGGIGVVLIACYLLESETRREYALSRYVETLEGLLPICASCKKIREPGAESSDPGSWTAIETYIAQRTQATFTHGICPTCRMSLYGELRGKAGNRAPA